MTPRILDGTTSAKKVKAEVAARVALLAERQVTPGLALVRVGDDPASEVYVTGKARACRRVGIHSEVHAKPADFGPEPLDALLRSLNQRPDIHGILLQLPLPRGYDEMRFLTAIDPAKDVDGFHPENVGRAAIGLDAFVPATPLGIQRLLVDHDVAIPGAHVVVVGRSNIVGRPVATLLGQRGPHANATVTLCHTGTRDLAHHTREADILIAAAGVPRMVGPEMVREGAVVVDVGIHRESRPGQKDHLFGDVDFDRVAPRTRAISPVPGGVGKMTVAMLLHSTVTATERSCR
jgi:methylenetetrahydrofolate dehydrogenase (NADP+)/methenyltetrahydrofolate cyclohydrolase